MLAAFVAKSFIAFTFLCLVCGFTKLIKAIDNTIWRRHLQSLALHSVLSQSDLGWVSYIEKMEHSQHLVRYHYRGALSVVAQFLWLLLPFKSIVPSIRMNSIPLMDWRATRERWLFVRCRIVCEPVYVFFWNGIYIWYTYGIIIALVHWFKTRTYCHGSGETWPLTIVWAKY